MGIARDLALAVGAISLLTFIALFGHVPQLRKTPVGWAHRFLRYTLPRWLLLLDRMLFCGQLSPMLRRAGNYIMHDRHPLVVAMYLALVTGSIYNFISGGWRYLSVLQQFYICLIIPLPYITLYAAMTSDPGYITPANHAAALRLYPYDSINFYPGKECSTCHLTKPARSKHCSVCKHCIAKHDHHCVWINNCVGLNNTRHFIAFLAATDLLLTSGAVLGHGVLTAALRYAHVPLDEAPLFSSRWLQYYAFAVLDNVQVGTAFLLAFLCSFLSWAFTLYHLYLIWAGTTTNETSKWSDWKDDILDGLIMIADSDPDERAVEAQDDEDDDEKCKTWPRKSEQYLYRIMPGEMDRLPRGPLWRRVESLNEIDNIYDLGWRANLRDVLWPGKLG